MSIKDKEDCFYSDVGLFNSLNNMGVIDAIDIAEYEVPTTNTTITAKTNLLTRDKISNTLLDKDIINKEQKLIKEEMLQELEKELQKLEFDAKYCSLINLKRDILKNIRIILKFIQCTAPYLLSAITITGVTKFITGSLPFGLNNSNISDLKGLTITLFYLLALIGAEYLTFLIINDNPHFDLLLGIKDISELYPKLDAEELQRKLQVRKENYRRLTK